MEHNKHADIWGLPITSANSREDFQKKESQCSVFQNSNEAITKPHLVVH